MKPEKRLQRENVQENRPFCFARKKGHRQMYHLKTRVRYSEVDEQEKLTVTALINLLQDCACEQSEALGIGLDYLREHHQAWVIVGWQIEILKRPVFMEELDVQTWPFGFKRFYGYRNFRICNQAGETLVRVNSNWIYIDTVSGRPTSVPEDMLARYEMEPGLEMQPAPRKMKLDEQLPQKELDPIAVHYYHLDTNHHVNNGQYVQMALGDTEKKQVSEIRVEYRHAAVLGNVIYPVVTEDDAHRCVALCNEQKEPYAMVWFGFSNQDVDNR